MESSEVKKRDKAMALISAAPEMQHVLQECLEYLSCIPETAAGGDDEAVVLARMIRRVLDRVK